MAARDGDTPPQTADAADGNILHLPERGDEGHQDATILG
jgi:hypothetical protein